TADILAAERAELVTTLGEAERALAPLVQQILGNGQLAHRLIGLAAVRAGEAARLDLRGPPARAAGLPHDLRRDAPSGAYALFQEPQTSMERPTSPQSAIGTAQVTVVTQRAGDAFARLAVRLLEALDSLRLARLALDSLPGGPVGVPGAGRAETLVAAALERRGEERSE